MFEINVEPLNFVNSHTDKGVPCKHCEAVDIPASMSIYNAMNRDLTNPWCRDSHISNTLNCGDGGDALNDIDTTSIYDNINRCGNNTMNNDDNNAYNNGKLRESIEYT